MCLSSMPFTASQDSRPLADAIRELSKDSLQQSMSRRKDIAKLETRIHRPKQGTAPTKRAAAEDGKRNRHGSEGSRCLCRCCGRHARTWTKLNPLPQPHPPCWAKSAQVHEVVLEHATFAFRESEGLGGHEAETTVQSSSTGLRMNSQMRDECMSGKSYSARYLVWAAGSDD